MARELPQNGKKIGPLILVEWTDSYGCSSKWEDLDGNYSPRPMTCPSIGWLVQSHKRCKVIVPHVSEQPGQDFPPQGCGDMTIPTKSIIRMVGLRQLGRLRSASTQGKHRA